MPSLTVDFFADDIVQIAALEGWSLAAPHPLDLYNFVPRQPAQVSRLRDLGLVPFFVAPDLKIAFFRPLSSALMWLDHTLFGRSPVPYHVHTLLWYAALLMTAAALMRRVLPAPLATLALLFFCLTGGHAMAAGWIAARNASVACVFAFFALVLRVGADAQPHSHEHADQRRQGRWPWRALAIPLMVALALAAGEMAVGAIAYLFAWTVAQNPGKRFDSVVATAPALAVVAIYAVVYLATGSGAHASGTYLDPTSDFLLFVQQLPERIVLLLGTALVGAPLDLLVLDGRVRVPLLIVGGGAALVVSLWLPGALRRASAEEAAAVRWLAAGAGIALILGTPAFLGERVLLAASLGTSVVLALLIRDAWRLIQLRRRRWLAVAGLLFVGVPNLALGAVALPAKIMLLRQMSRESRRVAREAEIEAPVPARVVVLALDDLLPLHLAVLRIMEQGLDPRVVVEFLTDASRTPPLPDRIGYLGTTVLSLSSAAHRLRRTAGDSFQLHTPVGTLLDGAWATTLRAPSIPMQQGSVVRLPFMTVTVVEDDSHGNPTRVDFRFTRPLDDPSLVFLGFDERGFRRVAMPKIGEEIWVPRRSGIASTASPSR